MTNNGGCRINRFRASRHRHGDFLLRFLGDHHCRPRCRASGGWPGLARRSTPTPARNPPATGSCCRRRRSPPSCRLPPRRRPGRRRRRAGP
uniref:Uncharacterized protein n=1 Tax=Arundo donax TaxID=35708 RepID=A0A0A9H5J4_ARUDO